MQHWDKKRIQTNLSRRIQKSKVYQPFNKKTDSIWRDLMRNQIAIMEMLQVLSDRK